MTDSTSKKVLIVKPSFKPYEAFPVGMAYVLACLEKNNIPFDFIDLERSSDWAKEVEAAVEQNDYYAVATGGLIGSYLFFQQLVSSIRKVTPTILVILGGNIVKDSSDPLLFKTIGIDYGIAGEAEIAFPRLLNAISGNHNSDINNLDKKCVGIPNLVYKNEEGKITRNRLERIDLANFDILPAWHHFDIGYYINNYPSTRIYRPAKRNLRGIPVISGRGCIGNCVFCSPSIGGFQKRPIPSIINEIRELISKYDFGYVHFMNEMFYPHARDIREFCVKYIESGIDMPWICTVRVDSNIDVDTFLLMKEAGCLEIFGGIESGSEKILKRMRKRITLRQIKTFFHNAGQADLCAGGHVILGCEGETERDIEDTIDLLIEGEINSHASLMYVYPGTELYQNAYQKGIIRDELSHLEKITRIATNLYSPSVKRDFFNLTTMSNSGFIDVAIREVRRYNTFIFSRNKIQQPVYRMYILGANILMRISGTCRHCSNRVEYIYNVTSGSGYNGILGDGVNFRLLCPYCRKLAIPDLYNCTKRTNLRGYFNTLKMIIPSFKKIILVGINKDTVFLLKIDSLGIPYDNILGVFDTTGDYTGKDYINLPVLSKEKVKALKPDCLLVTDCTVNPAELKHLCNAPGVNTPEVVFLVDEITREKITSLMEIAVSKS